MARIIDTTETFAAFARGAFLENPVERERLWREEYESAHAEVFAAFAARRPGEGDRRTAARELSRVRERVGAAAPLLPALIEEIEPGVRETLALAPEPAPVHVLLVDGFASTAVVGRLGDDVALFHCLEWFQSPDGARVLVAHESAHAWHEIVLGAQPPEDDPAWLAFAEGLAIQVSRAVVPGRPEEDYFWYGHPGFADWPSWCRGRRDALLERFRSGLDEPDAVDMFFGAGKVEGQLRVGFFVADELVGGLGRPLHELARLSADEARQAVRAALGAP